MSKFKFKEFLPHIVAVFIFFVLTAVYFAPVFQNKDIRQGDNVGTMGWGKDARDYNEQTGDYVYWSNSMFSGMPSNYTFAPQPVNIFNAAEKVLTLSMFGISRRHVGVTFLMFVSFYIFLLSLGCRSWLSIAGAIAYTLCSYNMVIIEAGHMSKSLVMATMAPVIGGVIMCYRGKLLWGSLITLVFTGLNVYWNHQQISYYLLLTLVILAVVYLVYAIREKWVPQYLKSSGVLILVALLAVLPAVGLLVPSADYAKESMRGGAVLEQKDGTNASGLDIDYAYQWSYGIGDFYSACPQSLWCKFKLQCRNRLGALPFIGTACRCFAGTPDSICCAHLLGRPALYFGSCICGCNSMFPFHIGTVYSKRKREVVAACCYAAFVCAVMG